MSMKRVKYIGERKGFLEFAENLSTAYGKKVNEGKMKDIYMFIVGTVRGVDIFEVIFIKSFPGETMEQCGIRAKILVPQPENAAEQKELQQKTMFYLTWFFEENNFSRQSFEITNVEPEDTKDAVNVTITLGRPGLLIGKGGRTMDLLKEHLTKCFQKEAKIFIIESKLWH